MTQSLWQKEEMQKTMGGLTSVPVTVWRVDPDWLDNGQVKRWKLIVTHQDTLLWMYTYDKDLASEGTKYVQLYQDNTVQMRRCIRKPKQENS